LIGQPDTDQHRPFERRAGWQALNFGGKEGLERAIVGDNWRSA
jgi:hypothetical protein